MTITTSRRRHRCCPVPSLLLSVLLLLVARAPCSARRGALVRDGMSSRRAYDNPGLGQSGDVTVDPDVVAITGRCPSWHFDPIDCSASVRNDRERAIVQDFLSKDMRSRPLRVMFRGRALGGSRRPNWMRATASLGDAAAKTRFRPSTPLRAVWTCSNADADTSITYEETNANGRNVKKEIGRNPLEDSYEDCVKRLYGKYVELEVLLPRDKKGGTRRPGPPPSVVYRVPIQQGHVNPLGLVSKSRATVTMYPRGRTLAVAGASGMAATNAPRDEAVPLGMTNVHVPLGPGLVDPGWAKGKKVFWRGRPVGLV